MRRLAARRARARDRAREHVGADGTVLEIRTHALGNGGAVRTYTDITERKNAEAQIIRLALHDSLTGLPNRRLFLDRLAEAIERANRSGEACAVLWIDLDRFKYINDLHGHVFGDRVLVQVAERLRGLLRSEDVVARFGGDEFCILRTAVGDSADGGNAGAPAAEPAVRALPGRRPAGSAECQHRHRTVSRRRVLGRRAAGPCRHRAVPRQGGPQDVSAV